MKSVGRQTRNQSGKWQVPVQQQLSVPSEVFFPLPPTKSHACVQQAKRAAAAAAMMYRRATQRRASTAGR